MPRIGQRVDLDIAEHIATVTLARPEKHNGLDYKMLAALNEVLDELTRDNSVRVVVLTGDGPSFCAGLDFSSVAADGTGPHDTMVTVAGSTAVFGQRTAYGWAELPVPVVAALRGACFGGGMQIALGADIRIAAPDTRMSVMEIKWGLVPDMGITQTLPRLVRYDVAAELTWTGRIFGAQEALELGLITRVAEDPREEALRIATDIAKKSPPAIRAGKELLTAGWTANAADALRLEEVLQRRLMDGDHYRVAVEAGMAKRDPQFDDVAPGRRY